jgi:hypothetical protein
MGTNKFSLFCYPCAGEQKYLGRNNAFCQKGENCKTISEQEKF